MTIRVLAVDDSFTMRELLRLTLKEAGFEVEVAVDGVDALRKLELVNPDLILTDLNMPNMDGFGLIDAVRAGDTAKRVPIVVLSTEGAQNLRERARLAGATGWLTKPFDDVALVSTIRRVTAV